MSSPSRAMYPSLQSDSRGVPVSPLRRKGSGVRSSRQVHAALIVGVALIATLTFGVSSALAAPPTFTVDPTVTAEYTTAQVSGTIDPGENEVFYVFQYAVDPASEGWAAGPLLFAQSLAAGSGVSNVSEGLVGLKPGTEYKLRLWTMTTDSTQEFTSEEPYVSFKTGAVAEPAVTIDPITTHTGTSAHLSGTVDPNAPAGPLSDAAKAVYATEWHFECTPECPGLSGGTVQGEEGSQAVSVDAKHLQPNTTYEVRLIASNAGGAPAASESFSTDLILASVSAGAAGSDGKGGFILEGTVNPHNSEVSACRFEYGLTTTYGKEVPCTGTPGAANGPVEVTAHLKGLTPGATYHFKVTATNGAGVASSADASFAASAEAAGEACPNEAIREEQHATFLPECRAYELVTNPFKQGFAVESDGFTNDGVFAYHSTGSFAGAGNGQQLNQYLATRTASGWRTESPDPPGSTYISFQASNGAEALSSDLRSSLFLMRRLDQPSDLLDLYLRSPDGAFVRVGPGFGAGGALPPAPTNPAPNPIYDPIVGSADLSHILVEYNTDHLVELVGTDDEQPRPVSVDNAGNPISSGGSTCARYAGLGEGGQPFATETANQAISRDGRVVFFTAGCQSGIPQVWARINGTTSVDASASECTRTASDPGGTCNAPAAATFEGDATDGSRVYFTTTQQLVNGDTDQTNDLYACDIPPGTPAPVGLANPCASLSEVSGAASGADVEDVIRVCDDGSRVYFVAKGVLAANLDANEQPAVPGDHNLYVWEKDAAHPTGTTRFIARLEPDDVFRYNSQSTADGRYFVFNTANRLVASDTDEAQDVYRYDADTGQMLRLSTGVSGTGGNTPGLDAQLRRQELATENRRRTAMTADASIVVFETGEALAPGGGGVYAWHDGKVSRIGPGAFPWIDDSGQNIYFLSNALTAEDGDSTLGDFYDARIDGGFPARQSHRCTGEACQATLSSPPATSGPPASTLLSGAGNLSPLISPAPTNPNAKPKSLTKAQKLAKALKACKKDRSKHKRAACEAQARKRYGAKHNAKSSRRVS